MKIFIYFFFFIQQMQGKDLLIVVLVFALAGGYYYFENLAEGRSESSLEDLTLTYFALQGRGEPIRLFMNYHNLPYSEKLMSIDEWKEIKGSHAEKKFMFGQLPHLQNGDQSIVQMNAILAHLDRQVRAKNHIVFGEKEIQLQEQIAYGIEDLRKKFTTLAYGSPDGLDDFLTGLPKSLNYFEQILVNNGGFYGKGNYLVGDDLTYVDIALWDVLDKITNPKIAPSILDEFPMVCKTMIYLYL